MNRVASFAYAQARLQARHAARPDPSTWRRLAGIGDRLHFLQHARSTGLRPWVLHFSSRTDVHELELSLRAQYRQYIREVAGWQPRSWRRAVLWTQRLLDLPALQHLLMGNVPPVWTTRDAVLKPFTVGDMRHRLQALEDSDYASLLGVWQTGTPLLEGWLKIWRGLWPDSSSGLVGPLDELVEQLRHRVLMPDNDEGVEHGSYSRDQLPEKLTYAFRRHSHQPAAAFVHLALVALDLRQLRAALLRRTLFNRSQGGET
jgi:hypothetical protein